MKFSRSVIIAIAAVVIIGGAATLLWPGKKSDSAVRLRMESFAISLNPLKINETESGKIAGLLYSPLVSVDRDGGIQSRLAERWKRMPDGAYEFVLKRGVSFTDGRPVTSRDVVASICRAMQPTSLWSWALASIVRKPATDGKTVECSGLEAIDADTVRIRESKPVPWLLHALDGPPGWVTPAEAAAEGEYNVLPGSGPYRIDRITPGESVELVARSSGADIAARAQRVVFRHVSDPAQAAILFDRGELDLIEVNTPTMLKLLSGGDPAGFAAKRKRLLHSVPADRVRVLIVNEARLEAAGYSAAQVAALKDRLRASVDRAGIVKEGNGLLAEELKTAFLPAAGMATGTPQTGASSEFPEISLTILTEADPYSDLIAAKVVATPTAKTTFTYRGVQKGALISAIVEKKFDIVSVVVDSNINAPAFWAAFFSPGSPFTLFGKPLPEMATIDVEDDKNRQRVASLIDSAGNWVPVVRERRVVLAHESVSGFSFTPSGQVSLARIGKK